MQLPKIMFSYVCLQQIRIYLQVLEFHLIFFKKPTSRVIKQFKIQTLFVMQEIITSKK